MPGCAYVLPSSFSMRLASRSRISNLNGRLAFVLIGFPSGGVDASFFGLCQVAYVPLDIVFIAAGITSRQIALPHLPCVTMS